MPDGILTTYFISSINWAKLWDTSRSLKNHTPKFVPANSSIEFNHINSGAVGEISNQYGGGDELFVRPFLSQACQAWALGHPMGCQHCLQAQYNDWEFLVPQQLYSFLQGNCQWPHTLLQRCQQGWRHCKYKGQVCTWYNQIFSGSEANLSVTGSYSAVASYISSKTRNSTNSRNSTVKGCHHHFRNGILH